jgi:hypothetical protein
LQKFGLKNDLRGFFDKYFYLLSTIVFLAWSSKVKTIVYHKIVYIISEKISKTKFLKRK